MSIRDVIIAVNRMEADGSSVATRSEGRWVRRSTWSRWRRWTSTSSSRSRSERGVRDDRGLAGAVPPADRVARPKREDAFAHRRRRGERRARHAVAIIRPARVRPGSDPRRKLWPRRPRLCGTRGCGCGRPRRGPPLTFARASGESPATGSAMRPVVPFGVPFSSRLVK